jgi:hypothetical protein
MAWQAAKLTRPQGRRSSSWTKINCQLLFVPVDGTRLPFFLEAETSERRRFLQHLVEVVSSIVGERTMFPAYKIGVLA